MTSLTQWVSKLSMAALLWTAAVQSSPAFQAQGDRQQGSPDHTGHQGQTQKRQSSGASMQGAAAMDSEFASKAASGGLMEVQLGKLAQQRGSSTHVKQIGRTLERDHSKANRELARIAKSQGMNIPKQMSTEHQAHVDQLRSASGQDFDSRFLEMQTEHHQKDIQEFQQEASEGQNQQLKDFASKQLPVLQKHLEMTSNQSGSASRDAESDAGRRQNRGNSSAPAGSDRKTPNQ